MRILRPSVHEDVPMLRQLWTMAFGDGEEYQQNFFSNYYQPERMLVLEENGEVLAMTAWFPSQLLWGEQTAPVAYLYAVATHPEHRSRGLAASLLEYCAQHLKWVHHFEGLTTVPAHNELHGFFAKNGFRECFVQGEEQWLPDETGTSADGRLTAVTAEQYQVLREEKLLGTNHVAWSSDSIAYQAGCCALSGGGMFRFDKDGEWMLLCVEGGETGDWYCKEMLGAQGLIPSLAQALHRKLGGRRYFLRRPIGDWQFGMLLWMNAKRQNEWDWSATAYLGPAFD